MFQQVFLALCLLQSAVNERAEQLVDELRSPSFAERCYASAERPKLGEFAIPAITAGLADPEPEVRFRCGELLTDYYRLCPQKHSCPKSQAAAQKLAAVISLTFGSRDCLARHLRADTSTTGDCQSEG